MTEIASYVLFSHFESGDSCDEQSRKRTSKSLGATGAEDTEPSLTGGRSDHAESGDYPTPRKSSIEKIRGRIQETPALKIRALFPAGGSPDHAEAANILVPQETTLHLVRTWQKTPTTTHSWAWRFALRPEKENHLTGLVSGILGTRKEAEPVERKPRDQKAWLFAIKSMLTTWNGSEGIGSGSRSPSGLWR